ncbi:hypothetical protein HY502_01090 [Candidatus Woesebacteria bacterium]|nr:hypothetical protein [Candidatus Woesebacteria bacterium]
MAKNLKKVRSHVSEIRRQVFKQMLALATSGFGLIAALAWNELIKEVVNEYIKPLAGENSGIISLLIYAILITTLAVTVTYNLTRFVEKEKH